MGKFRNGFVREVQEEKQREEEQRRLHEKHKIQDENLIVVEKNNMLKFLIRTTGRIIRYVATAAVFILAAVGLLALIYPEIRGELFLVLGTILEDAGTMIGI